MAPGTASAVTQVNLSSLNGSNGFAIAGTADEDFSGFSVSGIGDFDGDGYDDFAIGIDGYDPTGRPDAGAAFVVYGNASGFPSKLSLSTVNGTNGFRIIGQAAEDYAGISVNGAGDYNGDGFDDIIIGSHRNDPGLVNAGASYIVFGSATRPGTTVDLASMPVSRGVKISGQGTGDRMGSYVSGAGDFNGDGYDDVIIGANIAAVSTNIRAGKSYLVFGTNNPKNFFVNDMTSASGTIFNGKATSDESGWAATGIGDINGDGLDDIAISALRADPDSLLTAGETYVIFGSKTSLGLNFSLGNLNGTNGFTIKGDEAGGSLGFVAAAGGDINGDGFNDLLLSKAFDRDAYGYSPVAKKYIVYGRSTAFPASFSITALTTAQRTILDGTESDKRSGQSLAGAGDVNNDGFFDVLLGIPLKPSGVQVTVPGEAYLVYGKASLGGSLNVPSLPNADAVRYLGVESEDFAGAAVSAAGDVNKDGADDILIGALLADPLPGTLGPDNDAGESYLVFGTPTTNSAIYRTHIAAGNAAPKGVGLLGDGSMMTPASRMTIDYAAGQGTANANASLETVQLLRSISSINGGTFAPPTVWRLTSTRTGAGTFNVTLHYRNADIPGLVEDDLLVFRTNDPNGTWTKLTPTSIDKAKNQITVSTDSAGYFAIADAAGGNAQLEIPMVQQFDFNPNTGWFFVTVPPYAAPTSAAQSGYLQLTATNPNDITFGFWVTEVASALVLEPFNPMTDPSQTGQLHERQMPHYLARFFVKRSVADTNQIPQLRVRANNSTFEDYHTLDVVNLPNNPWAPSNSTFSPVDLFFHPHPYMSTLPANEQYYYLAFDIISVPVGGPALLGNYQLDRVEVFKVPLEAIEKISDQKTWDFSTTAQRNEWDGYGSQWADPIFNKANGRLEMSTTVTDQVYGNFQTLPFTLPINHSGITGQLYVRTKWRVGANEPNPLKVPQMRFRVMPQDFPVISVTGALDYSAGIFGPRQGSERIYYTYLRIPPGTASPYQLAAAWDLMVFEDNVDLTSSQLVYLEDLDVDLVRITEYP